MASARHAVRSDVGYKRARELRYFGDQIDAQIALDIGMINRIGATRRVAHGQPCLRKAPVGSGPAGLGTSIVGALGKSPNSVSEVYYTLTLDILLLRVQVPVTRSSRNANTAAPTAIMELSSPVTPVGAHTAYRDARGGLYGVLLEPGGSGRGI